MGTSSLIIIAIDGGAASGKSSTSRLLAERFNLLHVDTGSFYRQITFELLRRGVAHADLSAVKAALTHLQFATRLNGRSAQMLIDGQPAISPRSRKNSSLLRSRGRSSSTGMICSILPGRWVMITIRSLI